MTLTMKTLLDAAKLVKPVVATPRIVFTPTALKETTERLFPASKNRSKRIHKKLVRRFGGEFRMAPAMWQVGDTIYAHPTHEAEFKRQFQLRHNRMIETAIFNGVVGS